MSERKILLAMGCVLMLLCCLLAAAIAVYALATSWLDQLDWDFWQTETQSAGLGAGRSVKSFSVEMRPVLA